MVKIMYDGQLKTCRIKVGSAVFNSWGRGVVLEVNKVIAEKLLKVKGFKLVGNKQVKKEEPKKLVEKIKELKYDFNNDGVEDEKDLSLAGQALANSRKKRN